MTEQTPQRLVSDMRGVRYGEVLAVFDTGAGLRADVYGTQLLNDCPHELWVTLDAATIAEEMGALVVKLNGPRYWTLDGLGQKAPVVDPVLRDFNGLTMRRLATVDIGDAPSTQPYVERFVNRGIAFFFDAGKPAYEIVSPEGVAYVMQSYCVGVDRALAADSLGSLGSRLALPAGWTYRTRILDQELVIDTTTTTATVVQDELENTYTLPV
jgi:hypothetical protein